jgi:hypothetical protein
MRSRIEPMKRIARSLRQHRELILNYFLARKLLSSGVVEGLDNKAKLAIRRSYGSRTFRVLELALYHSVGKLPEPESTPIFSDESCECMATRSSALRTSTKIEEVRRALGDTTTSFVLPERRPLG